MTYMQVLVRAARPHDAADMAVIHVVAWQWAYKDVIQSEFLEGLDVSALTRWWAEALATTLVDGCAQHVVSPRSLVAECDEAIVAIASVGELRERTAADDPTGELWMLNAHPEAFGTGAAIALHSAALRQLAADGHRRAAL
jgi:hypothetical protein